MNAIEPLDTCRWCKKPIGLFPAGTATTWVHTGERGAFPCRDRVTGMCLPTYATPTTPPGGAIGRSRVEPTYPRPTRTTDRTDPPRSDPNQAQPPQDEPPAPPPHTARRSDHHRTRPTRYGPPGCCPPPGPRPIPRHQVSRHRGPSRRTRLRALRATLTALLRPRHTARQRSLARLAVALDRTRPA